MYIDGHTRAYFGKREVQKMHVARLKFPGPATEETWVTDGAGDPLLVVMAEPSGSLAAQIKELLPKLREIAGQDAKPALCFDRGGWSPDLFAEIIDAGFHLLTYRKASAGKDIPDLPADQFSVVTTPATTAAAPQYELAESASLAITKGKRKGETLTLRQVTRLDKGRQVHVLTDRQAGDLPGPEVIYKMGSRWREENYFRYGRAHFALDALDTYAVTPEDPDRKVPNPAKKKAAAAVKTAKKNLADAQAAREAKLTALRNPAPGQETSSPTRRSPGSIPRSPPPAASSKTPRPPPRPPPRISRCPSTTRTWSAWTPRPSSSPTPSGWPHTTPRPSWPARWTAPTPAPARRRTP